MSITSRPKAPSAETPAKPVDDDKVLAFVNGAPDGETAQPARAIKPKKRNKEQISLTIDPALLEAIDEHASQIGLGRAATISLACRQFLKRGAIIDAADE
jgi:hypothetical protein